MLSDSEYIRSARPTRNKHNKTILMPQCRTNAYRFSFLSAALRRPTITEWNCLPRSVVGTTSQDVFVSSV
ncbi:unnamed protein product, partial [Ixodes pacificus]